MAFCKIWFHPMITIFTKSTSLNALSCSHVIDCLLIQISSHKGVSNKVATECILLQWWMIIQLGLV